MIWEIILFVIACGVAAFTFWRKPEMTVPREFELVEREIEEWLRNPLIPSKAESIATAEISDCEYSEFSIPTKPTVIQSAMGLFVASAQTIEKNLLDAA